MVAKKTNTEKQQKTVVLLDAHAILHRAYHALPDFASSKGEPTGALYGIVAMLMKIVRELRPDYIVACYDLPEPTFRHEAYEDYKAGRAKTEDELVHQIVRSKDVFEAFGIPIYEQPGFEADDILGTIVEKLKNDKHTNVVIASGDMDTLQLVSDDKVTVYTLKKGINDTILYNEKAVKDRFGFDPVLLADYKGLRGDPSDNIIGIKGIGEKTATTIITTFGTIEDMYKALKKDEEPFKKAGLTPRIIGLLKDGEEEALFSKTLATIRRDAPIDFSLPKQDWETSLDPKKVDALLAELEFRTLRDRFKEAFAKSEEQAGEEKETTALQEKISDEELIKMKIATWLINSEITSPTEDDILDVSHANTLAEAQAALTKELKGLGLEKVYNEIELPLIPIIARAEKRGILVDVPYLNGLSKEYHEELSKIEKTIWEEAGGEFNINSPKQLGEILFDKLELSAKGLKKTQGGARSTRESELQKLKDQHPIVEHILAHRELQKLLSTYIDNIPSMVGDDGRLHAHLNQTGTTTGRMSSNNPNMQNIPVREGHGNAIRSAFIAEAGHQFLAFDYSQIELRVLAELSGDENLRTIFGQGRDVHAAVAARVFRVEEDEVTKDMRRKAKVINFGIIYGMGVNALKANLGSSRAEAQEFYDQYFAQFPAIGAYFEKVKAEARKHGYTTTLFGRRRAFGGIKSSIPYIRAQAERMAMNAPIQGTAADIIKLATKHADDMLTKEELSDKAHLLLSVHDELIYEAQDGVITQAADIIKDAMEHASKELSVPLEVTTNIGTRWGEMKEYKK